MKKIIIQIVLAIGIIILAYFSIQSIRKPMKFTDIKEERYKHVVQRLKDIREAQKAYLKVHKKYTGSFDTLINFCKNDSLPFVKSIGSLTDDQIDAGLTEKEAIRRGLIIRDTSYIAVKDTIFKKGYKIENLRYVPFTNKEEQFELGAKIIETASKVLVPIFQAQVTNDIIFKNIKEEYIDQLREENGNRLKFEKYPGLKVGSLTETNNNAGNWE